ncbi:MAG: hypothetical protein HFG05_11850 [Oscillibacter sp.]|nr:hypothetical protein [Oscillibacter sp.]
MKKTAHYQLNQWELEDRIRMSDFNSDNAKIDAAVAAALAKAVSEGKRLDTALNAAKDQLQTAVNTSKAQLQSSIGAVEDRLAAAKTALEAEDRRLNETKLELNTLLTTTVTVDVGSAGRIDLRGLDLGSYFLFSVSLEGALGAQINFNGVENSFSMRPNSSVSMAGNVGIVDYGLRGTFLFYPLRNPEAYVMALQTEGGFHNGHAPLPYKDLHTLEVSSPRLQKIPVTIRGIR